jgi:hypothetical protein
LIEIGILDGQYWARDACGSGRWYHIGLAWTLFPSCPCPFYRFAGNCKHTLGFLEHRYRRELALATETQTSTALVPSRAATTAAMAQVKREVLALGRAGYDDALVLAEGFCQAGLYGFGPKDKATAAIIIMTAADLDIPASQAFQYIAIVKGKPMLMARMVGALVWRSGKGKLLTITRTATVAKVRAIRDDVQTDFEITMQMAQTAGWAGQNALYKSVPANMLWSRAMTTAGWAVFPDVLAGMDMIEGGEVLEGFSPDAAYQSPVVVDSVQPEDMGPPVEAPAPEPPPAEGEFRDIIEPAREIPHEASPEASQPEEAPKAGVSPDQAFIEELSDMLAALQKTWSDTAEVLDTKKSKSAFIAWRKTRPEISDHVAWIRDRLLGVPLPAPQQSFEDLPE